MDSISGIIYDNWTSITAEFAEYSQEKGIVIYNYVEELSSTRAYYYLYPDQTIKYRVYPGRIDFPYSYYFFYNDVWLERSGADCNGRIYYAVDQLNYYIYWKKNGTGFWEILNDNGITVKSGKWD